MKKLFLIAWLYVCCLLLAGGNAFANENPYGAHLGGNERYILVDGHMGTAWYLDKDSLYVERYEPPQCIIIADICTVERADRGNTAISRVETKRFFYNWELLEMYVDRNGDADWRYLDPQGSWAETGIVLPAGEMAFYTVCGLRFYGSKKIYDSYGDSYYSVFTDDFYANAN